MLNAWVWRRVAREIERDNAKKLTKQAPILDVLNRLETDGASKQQQIEELTSEIKVSSEITCASHEMFCYGTDPAESCEGQGQGMWRLRVAITNELVQKWSLSVPTGDPAASVRD